ncbi:MAG: hypothetical protein CBC06_001895 [bacterium TMED46]|nr:MAG: hypothetical protein CBC06_001895 [bacterium TMED46]|tara:strand:- start:12470 stop:13453 length:984 start_codon:yes stop_codon:yes gene_type:complete
MLDEFPGTLISTEWHSAGYTPGDSDFEECYYYDNFGGCYGARASLYGVGGIPHSEWNGIYDLTGGWANGNWEPAYNYFIGFYNDLIGTETPYEIIINGIKDGSTVNYEITVSMDDNYSVQNQKVEIIVVEDNIMSYWAGANQDHNARNVARYWIGTEDLTINSAGQSQTFSGSFEIDEEAWNSDSVKIISMVQNYGNYEVFQVQEINVNEFDTDQDGVANNEDNCMADYNPGQEDIDGDGLGDACDLCDNTNIYIPGNVSGDYWYYDTSSLEPTVTIDVFDVLKLSEIIQSGEEESCGYQAGDLTGDGDVNIIDVIALASFVMEGAF